MTDLNIEKKKLNLQQEKRKIHEQIWDTGLCVFILCKNKPDRRTCLFISPPPLMWYIPTLSSLCGTKCEIYKMDKQAPLTPQATRSLCFLGPFLNWTWLKTCSNRACNTHLENTLTPRNDKNHNFLFPSFWKVFLKASRIRTLPPPPELWDFCILLNISKYGGTVIVGSLKENHSTKRRGVNKNYMEWERGGGWTIYSNNRC